MDNPPHNRVRFSTQQYLGYPNTSVVLKFVNLIADVLGIHIRPSELDGFHKKITQRAQALQLSSLDEYYRYLLTLNKSDVYRDEWRKLIEQLTITESYFFRDQGQFSLLKHQILPEIIERKRRLSSVTKPAVTIDRSDLKPTLRLWSAGCSTGEEAYSLAMLVRDLLPDCQKWDIWIVGTDINQAAIEWAKRGSYNNWSFRITEEDVKNRYFQSCKEGWEISSYIRNMVTFLPGNLVQGMYPDPSSKMHSFDLILCRNVFIYFDTKAIEQVLKKFYQSLNPQGILLTGHMELQGQTIEPFQIRSFPQSILYQRPASERSLQLAHIETKAEQQTLKDIEQNDYGRTIRSITRLDRSAIPSQTQPLLLSNNHLDELEKLLSQKAYIKVIERAEQLCRQIPNSFKVHYLRAEAYANLGDYSKANQACQDALQIDPLAIDPYYLLAQIAEVQGDLDGAKVFLKRIIYLAPTSVYAYFELGALYRREGNMKQAQKLWRSGLDLLQNLPGDQWIDSRSRLTVSDLKSRILTHLDSMKPG